MSELNSKQLHREIPILFKGDMVRAILADQKHQTRRINGLDEVNQDPDAWRYDSTNIHGDHLFFDTHAAISGHDPQDCTRIVKCPYGKSGDILWVRETWATDFQANFLYRASDPNPSPMGPYGAKKIVDGVNNVWRPSIFMPRVAARLLLANQSVRVERLQDISEADAMAEGVTPLYMESWRKPGERITQCTAAESFAYLWDTINKARGFPWSANPFVWVVEFRRLEPEKGS